MKALLDKGVDPNSKDGNDVTALMHAAIQGREEVVKTLLAAGADKNLQDYSGKTAEGHAAEKGNTAIVSLLRGGAPAE